ncbi:MAG: hypothetical protein FJW46_05820 [Actinobacteria bacterium]|nr:hypothetical protein [Actinomycetota bacterium]
MKSRVSPVDSTALGKGVSKWWELVHIAEDLLMKPKGPDVQFANPDTILNVGETSVDARISVALIARKVTAS